MGSFQGMAGQYFQKYYSVLAIVNLLVDFVDILLRTIAILIVICNLFDCKSIMNKEGQWIFGKFR